MTAVLPVDFTRLVWASLIGYLAFGEVPDAWTWVGGIMIFSATTDSAYRERRVRVGGDGVTRTDAPGAGRDAPRA